MQTYRRAVSCVALVLSWLVAAVLIRRSALIHSVDIALYSDGRRFFTAQAESILKGSLDVQPGDLPGECFTFQGECFGYYGLAPSVLRIPLLWIIPPAWMTSVMMFAAMAVALLAGLLLLNTVWRMGSARSEGSWRERWAFALAATCLSIGAPALHLFSPDVYDEAVAWAAALAVAASWQLLRWWERDSIASLIASGALFVLAANARPTAALVALAMGTVVVAKLLSRRGSAAIGTPVVWVAAGLAVAPLATSAAALYAKIHTLWPPLDMNDQWRTTAHWTEIFASNGGHAMSPSFVPTTLFSYFRPDAFVVRGLQLSLARPDFSSVDYLPPMREGGLFLTPHGGFLFLMAGAWVLVACALLLAPRLHGAIDTLSGWWLRLLVLAPFSGMLLVLANAGVSQRYIGDLAPALAMGVAVGAVGVGRVKGNKATATLVLGSVGTFFGVALSAWLILSQLALLPSSDIVG